MPFFLERSGELIVEATISYETNSPFYPVEFRARIGNYSVPIYPQSNNYTHEGELEYTSVSEIKGLLLGGINLYVVWEFQENYGQWTQFASTSHSCYILCGFPKTP